MNREARIRELHAQGLTDTAVGVAVGLSGRRVGFIRNALNLLPNAQAPHGKGGVQESGLSLNGQYRCPAMSEARVTELYDDAMYEDADLPFKRRVAAYG